LIEGFGKEMIEYQKEIEALKDTNKGLQLKLSMAAESRGSAGAGVSGKGAMKMGGDDGTLQARVAELQSTVKKKEQELVSLKEKQIKATDEKKGNNAKLTELTRKFEEEKNKVKDYLKAKMEAQDSLRNAR
jgi:predicted  nucleic acid-binding Zn-ribbon protein